MDARMCGIAGFCGEFDGELLDRMNHVQAHRGPDDRGVARFPDAGVGLAHRRLAILDLSPTGHQPMRDPSGRATIVYNGEIYNYRELRRELEQDGFSFRGTSDTEVLDAAGRVDGTYPLFAIMCIELWCRIFLGSSRPAPVGAGR
jgi:asparagine synthase (glutamine-hydrolysing)